MRATCVRAAYAHCFRAASLTDADGTNIKASIRLRRIKRRGALDGYNERGHPDDPPVSTT
jgi:hypothetical protein